MLLILLRSLVSQTSFLLFSTHINYLILLLLRPGHLSLPEGVWKFQATIASILLNFFFLAFNLIFSGSDLIPLMTGAWRPVLICIMDMWRKSGTNERKVKEGKMAPRQECSSKSNKHFESRPFLFYPIL